MTKANAKAVAACGVAAVLLVALMDGCWLSVGLGVEASTASSSAFLQVDSYWTNPANCGVAVESTSFYPDRYCMLSSGNYNSMQYKIVNASFALQCSYTDNACTAGETCFPVIQGVCTASAMVTRWPVYPSVGTWAYETRSYSSMCTGVPSVEIVAPLDVCFTLSKSSGQYLKYSFNGAPVQSCVYNSLACTTQIGCVVPDYNPGQCYSTAMLVLITNTGSSGGGGGGGGGGQGGSTGPSSLSSSTATSGATSSRATVSALTFALSVAVATLWLSR